MMKLSEMLLAQGQAQLTQRDDILRLDHHIYGNFDEEMIPSCKCQFAVVHDGDHWCKVAIFNASNRSFD